MLTAIKINHNVLYKQSYQEGYLQLYGQAMSVWGQVGFRIYEPLSTGQIWTVICRQLKEELNADSN